jgi:hypothetical protein
VRLKEKMPKIYNEDDNIALKATPKEWAHYPLELYPFTN